MFTISMERAPLFLSRYTRDDVYDDIRHQLFWPEPISPRDDLAVFRGLCNVALLYLILGAARIALTGTNSRPFLLAGTETFAGRPVDEKLLQEVDRLVQKQVQPMRTTIASANYRRVVAAALARRLIARLFAEAAGR